MEKSGLSRRTVLVGAAWSVPVIATAVATPLAAATGAGLLTGVFSPWTLANRQFSGSYTVTSFGVEADELDVAFYIGSVQFITVTAPAGWIEVDSGDELYRVWVFSGTPVTGFPYVFDYVVDEGYFTWPLGLEASLYSSLDPIDDSVSFDTPVTGFFTPLVSAGGKYYTTYIVRDFYDDQAAGEVTVALVLPAGASVAVSTEHGLTLSGTTITNTRTVSYARGAWLTLEIDPAGLAGSDTIGSTLSLAGTELSTHTLTVGSAFAVPERPTYVSDGMSGTYGAFYTLTPTEPARPAGWLMLAVTFQHIDDLFINLATAGLEWSPLDLEDHGDGTYTMTLLYFGPFTDPAAIYFGLPATIPLEETTAAFVSSYSGYTDPDTDPANTMTMNVYLAS